MEKKKIELTEREISDVYQGLVIAMKELDKYENGSDRILADRLEAIVTNIENQTR